MKKLFAILAVAGFLTACNNGDADKAATTDSSKMTPAVDANKVADSASKMMNAAKDTANKMMNKVGDSAMKMVDKAAEKMKDATNKMVDKAKEAVKH